MPISLSGRRLAPRSGRTRQLVVFLHGYGADGRDLLGLAPYWARTLPHAAFVAPDAPYPCEMSPYGFQWFSFEDRSQEMLLAGAQVVWRDPAVPMALYRVP